jgi:hypothetical protein
MFNLGQIRATNRRQNEVIVDESNTVFVACRPQPACMHQFVSEKSGDPKQVALRAI